MDVPIIAELELLSVWVWGTIVYNSVKCVENQHGRLLKDRDQVCRKWYKLAETEAGGLNTRLSISVSSEPSD